MSRKIFKSIILVSVVVMLAVLALLTGMLYQYYSAQYVASLKNETNSLCAAADIGGRTYLESLSSPHRLTLVDTDGTVLYDNVTDRATMGNHKTRTEIRQALETGSGYSERYSATLSHKTVNVAVRLKNGTVLRLSDTPYTVLSLLSHAAGPMVLIFLVAAGLSLLLAARVSRSITAPINRIDLEHPKKNAVYAELSPFVEKIEAQNQQISVQMAAMQKEHASQDAMRRDFTANVSHELKTPLTSISGYAEIMRDGIAKEEDIPRFAGKIYDESRRLIILVGDIIKLSQLDGNDIAVKVEPIDLYDTCQAVMTQLEKAARDKQVTVTLSGEHLTITGAEQIVEEIIFNLCDNAIKYNKKDGRVDITIRQCVDGVELTVSDTGIGIPKEDIPHIFERFYRVDKSHSKEIGGTGLGLSIVKHGAMFMNANVSVESEPDQGTTIRILF